MSKSIMLELLVCVLDLIGTLTQLCNNNYNIRK